MFKYGVLLTIVYCITKTYAYIDNYKPNDSDGSFKKLHKELFVNRKYDPMVIPLKNQKQINVTISFNLIHIVNLDISTHSLVSEGWLELNWQDEYLTWDESEFGGIGILRVPSTEIFIPDIMLYNAANYGQMIDYQIKTNALVYSNGGVMWVPPATYKSLCYLDLTNWPFDEHLCFLKFGSWTYDGFTIDLKPNKNNIDLSDYWANPEWDITYTNVTRHIKHYKCCPNEPYPDVTFYLKIKRKSSLYCATVFIPSLVAIILGLTSFWYPLRSTVRIILNVTSLLLLTYLLIYLGFKLGFSTNGTPKAVKFLSMVMLWTGISLIWTTIGRNLTEFKFKFPALVIKLLSPLYEFFKQGIKQDSIQLTNGDIGATNNDKPILPQQPSTELVTLAIDKIVFVMFFAIIFLLYV